MDIEVLATFINTVGFPGAAFVGMWYLVYRTISSNTEALHDLKVAIAELTAKKE